MGELANGMKAICLSKEENNHLCSPWKHSLIIKLLGKRITYQYLHEKLVPLWQVIESFPLIDLGLNFFIAKFISPESIAHVLKIDLGL